MVPVRMVFAALLVLCGMTAIVAHADTSGPGTSGSYLGHPYPGDVATVRFHVVRKKGRPHRAVFTGRRFALDCEDGSDQVVDFATVKARFFDQDSFRYDRYYEDEQVVSFYRVRGHLLGGGRARGDLLYIHDPFDPPGGTNAVECNWDSPWRAKQTRR
jgi:hypothetical protein